MELKRPGCANDPHLPLTLRLRMCGAIYLLRCVVHGVQRVIVPYSVFWIYNKKLGLWYLLNLCFTAYLMDCWQCSTVIYDKGHYTFLMKYCFHGRNHKQGDGVKIWVNYLKHLIACAHNIL